LAIYAFYIHSGWRDAFERQREYTRRDLFMGKLNPEKFSQRLQNLNKYVDYTPTERTTMADKTQKTYGKSFPDDEIISIMGQAIPPECTVKLLALGKEPWLFKYLEDQLNMYHQQWKADQNVRINVISKSTSGLWAPNKESTWMLMSGIRKVMKTIFHQQNIIMASK
jgi:hypothetical protein